MMAADQPPAVETVVVNAARLPTSLADAAFSIVTVDPNALQTLPRLDQVLETSPGVSLFRRGSSAGANPTTQGVSLRAIGPTAAGRALVTLDGVPQNDPFGNWVIWTALPTEEIQGVSIVRGAGAGPYGAGALTGVIDLQSYTKVDGGAMADISGSDLGQRRVAAAAASRRRRRCAQPPRKRLLRSPVLVADCSKTKNVCPKCQAAPATASVASTQVAAEALANQLAGMRERERRTAKRALDGGGPIPTRLASKAGAGGEGEDSDEEEEDEEEEEEGAAAKGGARAARGDESGESDESVDGEEEEED